jgi:multiple sugar transport system permease protein
MGRSVRSPMNGQQTGAVTQTVPRGVRVRLLRRRRLAWRAEMITAWGFLAPALVLLALLAVYPLAYSLYLSMTTTQVGVPGQFVGAQNFVQLLGTQIFALTLSNTVWYTVLAVGAKLVLGLILAVVLTQHAPGMKWIRGMILIPWVAPVSLSVLAWTWMFDSTYSVINWTLEHLGLISTPVAWLGVPHLARFAVILVNVWSGLPFFAINFLAGLVTIPRELYEAATVDGAGPLVRFGFITLPLLRPVLATVLLFSVIMTSSDFATVFVLTHGGPMNSTQILATLAFKLGLATGDLGQAAAISLYLFPVLALATVVQVRLMRRTWQW